jgi:hypothetical protein
VAPEPLTIVDTSPGNGSLVPAGRTTIAVLFSMDIDGATLPKAVTLDQISSAGAILQGVRISFVSYAKESYTATYSADPFPASTTFRLTVKKDVVRAVSGATLRTDLVRNFETSSS